MSADKLAQALQGMLDLLEDSSELSRRLAIKDAREALAAHQAQQAQEPVAEVYSISGARTDEDAYATVRLMHRASDQWGLRVRAGTKLYTSPQPSHVPGWQDIETAPEDLDRPVVVFWRDAEGEEQRCLDYTEDGCWMEWHNHAEHVEIIGGHGVSYTPPYTHWLPNVPAPQQGSKS